jgi:hypothetical protein
MDDVGEEYLGSLGVGLSLESLRAIAVSQIKD